MKQIIQFLLVFLFFIEQTISAEVRVIYDHNSPTKGIQEALNRASSEGGGMVFVPKGNYVISCSIVIPKTGNLTIFGEGSASVIEAEPEYTGFLSADAGAGDRMITARDPSLFKVHDKVVILDDQWKGEDETTTASVVDIKGNTVFLDTPLLKSYHILKNARLIHTFHLLVTEGSAQNVVTPGITVRDLQFIGSLKKDFQGFELWQVNEGIVLMGENLRIENCTVKDIPADAIFVGGGLQQKGNISVTGCLVENAGHRGIHVGNDPRNVNVSNNHFNRIGGIGIYLCHGCQRVVLSANTISDIGTYITDNDTIDFIKAQGMQDNEYLIKTQVAGIGGLGGGGPEKREHDKYDVISNNIIYNSKGAGISFLKWFQEDGGRPGENMVINGNNIYNIEKSAVFVFAAQAIQVSENMISDCMTGIDCSETMYCFFTGNTLRNCQAAFAYHSKDLGFPTMKNVSSNNMLINCQAIELIGGGVKDNISIGNQIINE
jgi:hypothetical protein